MSRSKSQYVVLIIAMAVFLCIVAPVSVELSFSPVPISLGTFAVLITALTLGWRGGLAAVALYIIVGGLGLPVFAGWTGGLSHLTGAGGGYIFGYLLMVVIAGLTADKKQFRLFWYLLGTLAAAVAQLLLGNFWLAGSLDTTFSAAAVYGVVPFVLFDGIKILAAWLIGYFMRSRIKVFIKPTR